MELGSFGMRRLRYEEFLVCVEFCMNWIWYEEFVMSMFWYEEDLVCGEFGLMRIWFNENLV